MKHKSIFGFLLALALFGQVSLAQNKPGRPDPTFGVGGRILFDTKDSCPFGDAILLPGDKFVAVCTAYRSAYFTDLNNTRFFRLIRFNSDGTLDAGFGIGGTSDIPVVDFPNGETSAKLLRLLPDGKILVAGTIDGDLAMVRVNADGTLDTTFGVDGKVQTDFAGFEERSRDFFSGFLIRPDGKLTMFGKSYIESITDPCQNVVNCSSPPFERMIVAQYNADGSPDESFGNVGIQRTRVTNDQHIPIKAFVAPGGKLQIAGNFYDYRERYWDLRMVHAIVQYNADGTLDTGFGKNGVAAMKDVNNIYELLPDGKILGVRHCNGCELPSPYNTRITRYNPDFSADQTFGTNGSIHHIMYYQTRVDLQPDGKFVLTAAPTGIPGVFSSGWILYRFNAEGSVDIPFGTNGASVFDLDGSAAYESSIGKVLFQSDGKILALGSYAPPWNSQGAHGIAVMRLIGAAEASFKSISRAR